MNNIRNVSIVLMIIGVILIVVGTGVLSNYRFQTNKEENNQKNEEKIENEKKPIKVYEFYSTSCPHCSALNEWFDSIVEEYGAYFTLEKFEVSSSITNSSLMDEVAKELETEATGVPFVVIGDNYVSGFSEDTTPDIIIGYIMEEYEKKEEDRVDIIEKVKNNQINQEDIKDNYEEENNNDENDNEESNNGEYDGYLSFEPRESIYNKFNFDIPSEFVGFFENDPSVDKSLQTILEDNNSDCNVIFKEVINFNSAEKLANGMINYYSNSTELETKEINGIKWYYFEYDFWGKNYTYLTEKDNELFMFEYQIEENAKAEICEPYKTSIINSVSYR